MRIPAIKVIKIVPGELFIIFISGLGNYETHEKYYGISLHSFNFFS